MSSKRRLLLLGATIGLSACAAGGEPVATPASSGPLMQYELGKNAAEPWPACGRRGEPARCEQALTLTRREGAQRVAASSEPVCCWECASLRNACGNEHWPGQPVSLGARTFAAGGRCEPTAAADFDSEGQAALRLYLDWLARTFGAPYLKDPAEVALVIPASAPRPTEFGVTAGEVSCSDSEDEPAFRITLFRPALEGRARQALYGALAHEFHHVVQIRRDGLACKPTRETKDKLEREAEVFAQRLVPPCH